MWKKKFAYKYKIYEAVNLTLHGYDTLVCTVSKIIGINTENKICLPSKEYINSPIVCVVLALDMWKYCSGEQARQPNICNIPQSSLYSSTIVHKTK